MGTRTGASVRVSLILLFALITGCRSPVPTEVTAERVDVVDQPFPPNYPSSRPVNPRTIATLHRGDRIFVRAQAVDKDFMYYTVELSNGQRGYVIFSGEWPFQQRNFYEYAK